MTQLTERIRFWISEAPIITVVISVLAVYAVYKNLWTYHLDSAKDSNGQADSSLFAFTDQMTNLIFERLFTWGGVSVVALILTMILKHYNDKHDKEETIRKELLGEESENENEGETETESNKKANKNKKPSGNKAQSKNEKKVQKQKKTN